MLFNKNSTAKENTTRGSSTETPAVILPDAVIRDSATVSLIKKFQEGKASKQEIVELSEILYLEQQSNKSLSQKIKGIAYQTYRSYLKIEEMAKDLLLGSSARVSSHVAAVLQGKTWSEANVTGINSAADYILNNRDYYQTKYADSLFGSDHNFSKMNNFSLLLRMTPIEAVNDLVFGTTFGLIDIVFKDHLGHQICTNWNKVLGQLKSCGLVDNPELYQIKNRKEFMRWWGHCVETIEITGSVIFVASTGGTAGLGFLGQSWKVTKFLGRNAGISGLSSVAQEWLNEDKDNYYRAAENAFSNMASSALFSTGISGGQAFYLGHKAKSFSTTLLNQEQAAARMLKASRRSSTVTALADTIDDSSDIVEALENVSLNYNSNNLDQKKGAFLSLLVASSGIADGRKDFSKQKDMDSLVTKISNETDGSAGSIVLDSKTPKNDPWKASGFTPEEWSALTLPRARDRREIIREMSGELVAANVGPDFLNAAVDGDPYITAIGGSSQNIYNSATASEQFDQTNPISDIESSDLILPPSNVHQDSSPESLSPTAANNLFPSETKATLVALEKASKSGNAAQIVDSINALNPEARKILTTADYVFKYGELSTQDREVIDQATTTLESLEAALRTKLRTKQENRVQAAQIAAALWQDKKREEEYISLLEKDSFIETASRDDRDITLVSAAESFLNCSFIQGVIPAKKSRDYAEVIAQFIKQPNRENFAALTKLEILSNSPADPLLALRALVPVAVGIHRVPLGQKKGAMQVVMQFAVDCWLHKGNVGRIEQCLKTLLPGEQKYLLNAIENSKDFGLFPKFLSKLALSKELAVLSRFLVVTGTSRQGFAPVDIFNKQEIVTLEERAEIAQSLNDSNSPLFRLVRYLIISGQFKLLDELLDIHILNTTHISTFIFYAVFDLCGIERYDLLEALVKKHGFPYALVKAGIQAYLFECKEDLRPTRAYQLSKFLYKLENECSSLKIKGGIKKLLLGKTILYAPKGGFDYITAENVVMFACTPCIGVVESSRQNVFTFASCNEIVNVPDLNAPSESINISSELGYCQIDLSAMIDYLSPNVLGERIVKSYFSPHSYSVYFSPIVDNVIEELEGARKKTLEVLHLMEGDFAAGIRELEQMPYLKFKTADSPTEEVESADSLTENQLLQVTYAQLLFINQCLLHVSCYYKKLGNRPQGWARGLELQNQAIMGKLPPTQNWQPDTKGFWQRLAVDLENIDLGQLMPALKNTKRKRQDLSDSDSKLAAKKPIKIEFSRLRNLMSLPGFKYFLSFESDNSQNDNPNSYVAAVFEYEDVAKSDRMLVVLESPVIDNATYIIDCSAEEWDSVRRIDKQRLRKLNDTAAKAELALEDDTLELGQASFIGRIEHDPFSNENGERNEKKRRYFLTLRRKLQEIGIKGIPALSAEEEALLRKERAAV